MTIDYREIKFEEAIEASLLEQDYSKGDPHEFDPLLGLFPSRLISFVMETQPKAWEALCQIHGSVVELNFLTAVINAIQRHPKGFIGLFRDSSQGKFKDRGIPVRLFYLKPDNDLNPDAVINYRKNKLTVTRQVHYSVKNNNSLDVVIDVNGFPIITLELKNPLTGQNYENAIEQYKHDRDPNEPIFRFNERSLVHFAVDPNEVHMTTRLDKEKTAFLPFNRGDGFGKGNPEHPSGLKTAYLWEEILEPYSLFDILQKFMELQIKEDVRKGKIVKKKQLIFPRFHQLDAVRKTEADAKKHGPGKRYLIQHSAGSGKSNTIGWLAYRLASLSDKQGNVVFNTVVVVTDRRVLDRQIQETIHQFDSTPGFVAYVEKSNQLAHSIAKGTKIVATTLQKFPFVIEQLGKMPQTSTFAIIMDEAHSSQTGITATKMKEVLSYRNLEDAEDQDATEDLNGTDVDDQINRVLAEYKRKQNMSLFAFTATPKKKTLELFGQPGPDGKPVPFHLYSMRQAIEEGFILDVLKNYTTYKSYYEVCKQISDDPEVESSKTMRGVARFVQLHPTNLAQKAEVIIEHFRNFTRHKISGQAKAMVVTSSRLHAKRYTDALKKYIHEKGYTDLGILVAFSGKVNDEEFGEIVTESDMNGFPDTQTAAKFEEDIYGIMIVADKYQTGFDQPLLHTMYVDKKLTGVKAVQTLSRLNRTHPGKFDTFVLDFVNDRETIRKSFQPYYEQTEIDEPTDPNLVYAYQRMIDEKHIFEENEIDAFCQIYFNPKYKQSAKDLGKLYQVFSQPIKRYRDLIEDERVETLALMSKFTSLYLFLSQMVEYDEEMKRYFSFVRLLLEQLKQAESGKKGWEFPNDLVDLEYYRLRKVETGDIQLVKEDKAPLTGYNSVGHKAEDKLKPLSELIAQINDRFGEFGLDEGIAKEQLYKVVESFAEKPGMQEQVQHNTYSDFRSTFDHQFVDGLAEGAIQQKQELEEQGTHLDKLIDIISSNDEVLKAVSDVIGKMVYDMLKH